MPKSRGSDYIDPMLGALYLAGASSYIPVKMAIQHEDMKINNPYKHDWMLVAGLIIPAAVATNHVVGKAADKINKGSHIGGVTTLGVSYAASAMMLKSGNPYLMAAGGVMLAIPDPVIYGLGYYLFD